jgi:NAD(P)-dependent dehydrogenase (short-subunit alcohol dehydrogenase family)
MKRMEGAAAVVIGGGGGVGRGVCLGLAAQGMKVMVADRDADAATRVAKETERESPTGLAVAAEVDATDEDSLAELRTRAVETLEHVDVLAITLGTILQRPLHEVTVAEWEWLWRVNVLAPITAVNVFLPLLRSRHESHIVLTAAGAGLHAAPADSALGAYGVVKHALVGYGKNLRLELARDGIGVTVLCPTAIAGRLADTSARSHEQMVGASQRDVGGRPAGDRKLDNGRVLGPVVVDAIRSGAFIASNSHEDLLRTVEDEHRSLVLGEG